MWLVVAFLIALAGSRGHAQGQDQQSVEVNLGSDMTTRGGPAQIPVILFTRGTKVGKVAGEVTFPGKLLSYDKAVRGSAGEEAAAEVSVELLNDGQDTERSILRVVVSATKEIPPGVLLDLRFRVSPDAEVGVLALKNALKAMTLEGEEIKGVKGKDGEVDVKIITPVVACFFFTH